jgi:antitoxin CcdA
MPRTANPVKRAVNLSLNAQVLDTARELGLNVSATVDALLAEEVRRIYWERWNEENKGAIEPASHARACRWPATAAS